MTVVFHFSSPRIANNSEIFIHKSFKICRTIPDPVFKPSKRRKTERAHPTRSLSN